MKLTYHLRKVEFKKDFSLFMCELAKETKAMDRLESVAHASSVFAAFASNSEEEYHISAALSGVKVKNKKKQAKSGKQSKGTEPACKSDSKALATGKRYKPSCLNPDCDGHHFINECPMTRKETQKELLKEYRKAKNAISSIGHIGRIGNGRDEENSSLFKAEFCNGKVEVTVLADQGADVNLIPPHVFEHIKAAKPQTEAAVLGHTDYYGNVDKSAAGLPCSRSKTTNVTLQVRHAEPLILRKIVWMICDRPTKYVIIALQIRQALGLDNKELLSAACQSFKGLFNVPTLLSGKGGSSENDNSVRNDKFSEHGTIRSLLKTSHFEFWSTFRGEGEDGKEENEESDVYIDIGEDSEHDPDAALAARVQEAQDEGMSEGGTKILQALLQKHKQVFE